MSPCSPNDVSLNIPNGPSGPAIPGFGIPFALKLPQISLFPDGFPEDLLDLLNRLQLLIPPGALLPQLNLNFGKDVFDAIMKLLDQFMPFLMLYKFFLPILNIILCIIEVLCALMNPFALISAIKRLFTQCIPAFLNLFPILALIIMIISLLLLIIALIEYIIQQILKLIQAILRNILALTNAFQSGDANGVLAIAQKLGALLCIFQNLFVLLALFNIIIGIIRDILSLAFAIPPCQSGGSGDDGCCTPNTCPEIVQGPYTLTSGTLKYFPEIGGSFSLGAGFPAFTVPFRSEMWQLYDIDQNVNQAFRNIFDANDITTTPKPVFFPAGTTYDASSDIKQIPYLFDLRLFYNPSQWGRSGNPRFIQFKNCIMTTVPTTTLVNADNSTTDIFNGVASIVGGSGFEDDGTTPLQAYGSDGVTPISGIATINNFLHMPATFTATYVPPSVSDGYTFVDSQYTFNPNIAPLVQKNLVTIGCVPDVALNRDFINNVVSSDVAVKAAQMNQLLNSPDFPNPDQAQQCLTTAISALRSNMTVEGVAAFQTTCNICLNKLLTDTKAAIGSVINIGADPCKSTFTLDPHIQFTTLPIIISVILNETNGINLANNLPSDVGANLASQLQAYPTFGVASPFSYDGYSAFNATLTSDQPGSGSIMISFQNQMLCTNIISNNAPPVHTLQSQNYEFVYTTVPGTIGTGERDVDGKPRRDAGDISRDGGE